jgi:hypothetical protein
MKSWRRLRILVSQWYSHQLDYILLCVIFTQVSFHVYMCVCAHIIFLNRLLNIYSLRLKIMVTFALFVCLKIIVIWNINATFFSLSYTLIYWISLHLTTPITTINKGVLVSEINFTIELNQPNHFLRNHVQSKCDN